MRDKREDKCYLGPLPNSLPSPTTLKHALQTVFKD